MEGTALVRRTANPRPRGPRRFTALLLAAAVLAVIPAALPGAAAAPAAAAPSSPGDEGGTKKLRDALESASKGHVEATTKLTNSKKRQRELGTQLKQVESRIATLTREVGVIAAESYRRGRLTPISALLNSASPQSFLERAAGLEMMAQRNDKQLRELAESLDQATRAKNAIDAEVREQQRQVEVIARKKRDAERALAAVGGNPSGGLISANSPLAKPAPRNSDGSWPRESCSIDDPTTNGCITPRTLHALNQAKANGFKRHASCHRSGGGGEHPKGRACDFSAATGGFENVDASGGDRSYGNSLAAFYVKNASRLGVLYVIWYRQIWMPGTGWRGYNGNGDPASDHTNHVHLSML
ncbi:coiled-coil domain-containing protein [Plantactinospora sp. WMMC1484]|uniref:coiled-coil domain-containing protein n=1 Tax=Plantactinospora sp. WMMC1484 TaxID=3404122 RepID=UPI003BF53C26